MSKQESFLLGADESAQFLPDLEAYVAALPRVRRDEPKQFAEARAKRKG